MRKLSENFNYTYRLHLVLVIRIYFDKVWFIQKYKQQESWWNKKSFSYVANYLNMFNTKHYIKYNNKYTISYYLLSFLHNLKLKTELIIDWKVLLLTELGKFGVMPLLYYHKGILPSHWLNIHFKNFTMFGRIQFIA